MKSTIIVNGLMVVVCMVTLPHLVLAENSSPSVFKINYAQINRVIADTTLPGNDQMVSGKVEQKADVKKEEKPMQQLPAEVVKVIPKARRQPIPVPIKVNVRPVKIIKPKIIKPIVKPVIKILH